MIIALKIALKKLLFFADILSKGEIRKEEILSLSSANK